MKEPTTVEEVRRCVAAIAINADDNSSAHADEDSLYIGVLRAIAEGKNVDDPAKLAHEALKASDIQYDRWYA